MLEVECLACGGNVVEFLGRLGAACHVRCKCCGWVFEVSSFYVEFLEEEVSS
jgi:hypothetical protein